MKELHTESMDNLFRAILELKTVDECYDFFEDVCTIKEMKEFDNGDYIGVRPVINIKL